MFLSAISATLFAPPVWAAERKPIDYNRQIRPILSNYCLKCHGPDEQERQAGLRLDLREAALAPAESGRPAIVPGKADESRLVQRIFSDDPGKLMPPPESNKKLSAAEKQLLKDWIAEGAGYQEHWAFLPVKRPAAPKPSKASRKNTIDDFLAARRAIERANEKAGDGWTSSPEADRTTLLRRVTLDLTGLPPTIQELDSFLADRSVDAYEKVVDRLLASPHFGERLAVDWLDASRFADTHGYHIDSGRDMSRWREYVIEAFNANKPFDQFTIEQLAGDLLPGATREQKIASGFNRNHMINFEGGAIPEEYHTAYIVDRVNTTAAVWLGLTINCAQCHDHKYDPITQKEFYQLFSFFYNVPENGLDGSKGNASPLLKVPSAEQERRHIELTAAIQSAHEQMEAPWPELDKAQAAWEKTALDQRVVWKPLLAREMVSAGGAALKKLDDESIIASGENPAAETYSVRGKSSLMRVTALRLEALNDESLPAKGPGRSANGNAVLTNVRVAASGDSLMPRVARFKAASADYSQNDYPVAQAIDENPQTGWAIFPEVGKPHVAIFELADPLILAPQEELLVTLEFQSQFGQHQFGRFRLSLTEASPPHDRQKLPESLVAALSTEAAKRSDAQKTELKRHFRTHVADEGKALGAQLARRQADLAALDKAIPTTMIMQEMDQPRDAYFLIRGQYDKKGDKVLPGVPAVLPPLTEGLPHNRLGLAQWLVAPSHPLTSRVIVNRYWQMLFGTGLVKTAEDFGSQGEPPSHPELLDWLAAEFMQPTESQLQEKQQSKEQGWNVKALLRLIVTSAAYRQSSTVTAAQLAKDPENRLLARGPRFRLQAEFIRDLALSTSGLINRKIGGPSVSPYQPPGLWEELMSREDSANWTAQTYVQSHGEDLYRRTMYTFWKRTCPPPTLATFDAPDRETCTVRRARTNTPLQALILLNDPTYVEASRKMAERLMTEGGQSVEQRIAYAFRLATARTPRDKEIVALRKVFEKQRAHYAAKKEAALKLLSVGESSRNEALDPADLAAWTTVASVILNLDETITRG
jgi:Protein of unknown function (DUF1553)/Protein of unknown function (DUF1549)/Planctomycete cytochrome C